MQNKITEPSKLLDTHGGLIQKGYATSLLLEYKREDVKFRRLRLKEWDYYLIYNDDYGIALTMGDSLFAGLISATFIDFKNVKEKSKTVITSFPAKKINMPESSITGDIIYKDKNVTICFMHDNNLRKLYMDMKNFDAGTDLNVSIQLSDEPADSMVIATPFKEDKKAFYYNQKIIGMRASGTVSYRDKVYEFKPESSFGLLDWGRGVWPYNTTWYWSAAQGIVNDKVFGFNLGYGFGDTSAATENMLFYNGIASKLEDVVFAIPENDKKELDYMSPRKIISLDGDRVNLTFDPIIDRNVFLSAVLLSTDQHQVFGKFSGKVILDNNKEITLKNFMGFAERVENRW